MTHPITPPPNNTFIAPATAALAQPEPQEPTDEELLELMPETMRDEFSYAAKVCSDATGGQVKPGIFRVALNTAALEYARAVLETANAKPTPNPSQIRTSLVERVRRAIVEAFDERYKLLGPLEGNWQEPTDEELHQLWLELYAFHDGPTSGDVAEISRAALQRWGCQ